MKKLLTVLSVILVLSMMLAAFASCGSKDEKETDSESKQGSIETPGGNETEKETDSGETEKETDKEDHRDRGCHTRSARRCRRIVCGLEDGNVLSYKGCS